MQLSRPAPDPVPPTYLRALISAAGVTQERAAEALHVDPASMRRWLSDPEASSHRQCPWIAAELLRRMVKGSELRTDP